MHSICLTKINIVEYMQRISVRFIKIRCKYRLLAEHVPSYLVTDRKLHAAMQSQKITRLDF